MIENEYTVKQMMQILNCTEEQARDLIRTDREIDRGADPFPLTAEQKAVEKEMRRGRKAPTAYKFQPRERKPNEAKRYLIDAIEEMLQCSDVQAEDVTIVNPERQIDFTFGGVRYRVVLSAPRK